MGRAPEGRVWRFLVSGAANTLLTYLLYLVLLANLGHRLAYSVAFASGVALAYCLGRVFVFKTHAGWRSVWSIPLIYLLQFGLGLLIVELWIVFWGLPAALAPLAAVVVTLPCTYVLSRWAFARA
jgi:putative flippase GtrA